MMAARAAGEVFWWTARLWLWLSALLWAWSCADYFVHRGAIVSLEPGQDTAPPAAGLAVIVPARNEAAAVEATVRSLLAERELDLEVAAIDDRSTDATGAILDRLAAELPRLRVIHVRELPAGWLGKPHAMALAARSTEAPWLLFTDADVLFAPGALKLALGYAERHAVDHLVVLPTMVMKTPGERAMLGMMQLLGGFRARPWRIADPFARDFLGVGAFNLVRRRAYLQAGGFESLRGEVLEDLRLGWKIKRGGWRQHAVTAPGMVSIRWAEGAMGIIANVRKNAFAVFRFRTPAWAIACAVLAVSSLLLPAGLLLGNGLRVPALAAWGAIAALFLLRRRQTGVPAVYALAFPFAALLLAWGVFASGMAALRAGGVLWRGTLYPLAELRREAGPWWW